MPAKKKRLGSRYRLPSIIGFLQSLLCPPGSVANVGAGMSSYATVAVAVAVVLWANIEETAALTCYQTNEEVCSRPIFSFSRC